VRHAQPERNALIHSNELDREAQGPGERKIGAQHESIGAALPPPAHQQERDGQQRRHFVELGWMHRNGRGRQTVRKRHGPWQVARRAVVVADEKASDPPDGMTNRQTRRRCREYRENRESPAAHQPKSRKEPAGEAAKPTQATAGKQEVRDRFLSQVFRDPEQLRADESAGDARQTSVDRAVRQARAPEFAAKKPQPDERADGDENAKAGDLDLSDAKEDRIDGALGLKPSGLPRLAKARLRSAPEGRRLRPRPTRPRSRQTPTHYRTAPTVDNHWIWPN